MNPITLPQKRPKDQSALNFYLSHIHSPNESTTIHNLCLLQSLRAHLLKNTQPIAVSPKPENRLKKIVIKYKNNLTAVKKLQDFCNGLFYSESMLEYVINHIRYSSSYIIISSKAFKEFKSNRRFTKEDRDEFLSGEYVIVPIIGDEFSFACVNHSEETIEYFCYNEFEFEENCEIIEEMVNAFGIHAKYDWELMEIPDFVNNQAIMASVMRSISLDCELSNLNPNELYEELVTKNYKKHEI